MPAWEMQSNARAKVARGCRNGCQDFGSLMLIESTVVLTSVKCKLVVTCPAIAFPACIHSKDASVKFAQAVGDALGSRVLEAAKGQGGYNERMLHNRCEKTGQSLTPVRWMPDVPIAIDGVVTLVKWPWLPPSELLAAIIKLDSTRVTPPADYWEQMMMDFPGHPAGLLGRDAQACDTTYNTSQHVVTECGNTHTSIVN